MNINGTYGTRGINGLTCNGSGSSPAILLDGSNNTIQNVSISGYSGDGIRIGSQIGSQTTSGAESNNLLFNITGSSVTNLVHICGSSDTSCGTSSSLAAPSDITLMGVNGGTTASIEDDVTSANLSGVVGHVLGEQLPSGGYSRFTTNNCANNGVQSCPAWFVGPSANGPVAGTTSCSQVANGSLFSATTSTTSQHPTTLLGCIGSTWQKLSGNF